MAGEAGPFFVGLGLHIRAHRKAANLQPSDIQGITQGRIRVPALESYERGDRRPSVEDLCRLARCFRVEPCVLIPSNWDDLLEER